MSYNFLIEALQELVSGEAFKIDGDYDLENVTWIETPDPMPSNSAIISKCNALQSTYDGLLYARNREKDYPSQGDQMDMIYKDMLNSTTTHKDAVEAVKTKWPKNNKGPIE